MSGLLLVLLLLLVPGPKSSSLAEKDPVYKRCFEMDKHFPGCDPSIPAQPAPKECYTLRSESTWIPGEYEDDAHLPFGCHLAPCSTQNEAFWLGMYPREDFEHFLVKPPTHYFHEEGGSPDRVRDEDEVRGKVKGSQLYDATRFRKAFIQRLSKHWKHFKNFWTDEERQQIEEEYVERSPLPDYVNGWVIKSDGSNYTSLPKTSTVVPLLCDPRSYLVCDHSYEVGEYYRTTHKTKDSLNEPSATSDSDPDTPTNEDNYELTGRCNCHPLYSRNADEESIQGRDKLHPVTPCLGRPNVPCEFARWVTANARNGPFFQYNLTDLPPPGYEDQAVGYTTMIPPQEDQFAFFINPDDLHDQVKDPHPEKEKEDKETKKWVSRNSECIPEASCELFSNLTELERFRRGEMWQGFGIHPIVRDMMLQSATKVCQCKAREGYIHSGMHDCIKLDA